MVIALVTVEVPQYKVEEKVVLNPKETAVIVVDMQNDFAHPDGKLFVPSSRKIIEPIKKILEKARKAGVRIFYTQDWHIKDDPEFKIWGEHAVGGTWGAEVIDELKPQEGDILIKKLKYDGFFGTSLDIYLREFGIKNTIIIGTVANICVLHTASSAALHGYKVILPIDAIAALNEFDYHATLRQVEFLYKGILTKVDGIEFKE